MMNQTRTCRVLPDRATCSTCLETQIMFNIVDDCNKCLCKRKEYELIEVGSDFWGDYAIVLYKGKPKKVSLNRVVDIKDGGECIYENR